MIDKVPFFEILDIYIDELESRRQKTEVRYNIERRKQLRNGNSSLQAFEVVREQLNQFKTSSQNLQKTRKVWNEIKCLIRMLPVHMNKAIQATAFLASMFPIQDEDKKVVKGSAVIPYFDPLFHDEITLLQEQYPDSFVDEIRRLETIKYVNLGSLGQQALATLFVEFDYYAFYNHYSSHRNVSLGMFMSPYNASKRLVFEYLTGKASIVPMEIHFPVGDKIKYNKASIDIDSEKNIDENIVDKFAVVCLGFWRSVFGSTSCDTMDALMNREIQESEVKGSVPLVFDTYLVSASSPEFLAIDTFARERAGNEEWNNEVFASFFGGVLHGEDVIYKTRRLFMVEPLNWFLRNHFLNDSYPFKQRVIQEAQTKENKAKEEEKRKQRIENLEKNAAEFIQSKVRMFLVYKRYQAVRTLVLKLQRTRRASVHNREICQEYKYAFLRIRTISQSLRWFFSWENLKKDAFLLNSIDDSTCTVSFETLAQFNSIRSVLVGRSYPYDIIEMAARSINFIFVTKIGIGRKEWLEKKRKLERRKKAHEEMMMLSSSSPQEQNQNIPVAKPVYSNYYYQQQQQQQEHHPVSYIPVLYPPYGGACYNPYYYY